MSLARQRGFTLLESMMAGVISTVLAGVVITSLYLTSDSVKEGREIIKASQKANLVSWQFRTLARQAYAIVPAVGPDDILPPPDTNAATGYPSRHIYFVGPPPSFEILGGFELIRGDNRLREAYKRLDGKWDFKPFVIGNRDSVFVRIYNETGDGSRFELYPGRRGVNFQTAFMFNSISYLPIQIERVLCRNQNR